MTIRPFALLLVAACAAVAMPCAAHERSASYSSWTFDAGGADVEVRMDGRDLTRLPEAADGPGAADLAIVDSLRASRGGMPCSALGPPARKPEADGRFVLRWRVGCASAGPVAIESLLPGRMATPHLAFTRIQLPGAAPQEVVLHADGPRWEQAPGPAQGGTNSALEFFRLGLRHIAGGIDHLFFLSGLVVAAASLPEVAVVVTAFTLAHALTLAAATLGLLRPAAPTVEALIALSIALLAVENLTLRAGASRRPATAALLVLAPALLASAAGAGRVALSPLAGTALFAGSYLLLAARHPQERRLRWLVAFAFGLLHGFGFAGALVESGFAGATVAVALLAFHAGVESGQLLFVALLWPLLRVARGGGPAAYARFVLEPASVVLLVAAVGWYATRAFG